MGSYGTFQERHCPKCDTQDDFDQSMTRCCTRCGCEWEIEDPPSPEYVPLRPHPIRISERRRAVEKIIEACPNDCRSKDGCGESFVDDYGNDAYGGCAKFVRAVRGG